jgi:P27 family predicted phage terminase small subunit
MRGTKPASILPGSSPVKRATNPPTWLTKAARDEWKRVAPILIDERKTLTMADLATFTSYCNAVGQISEAAKIIAAEGMTFAGAGGPKKHPAVAIQNDAMTQARLLAAELGLTPVSRSRPSIREIDDDDDLSHLDI